MICSPNNMVITGLPLGEFSKQVTASFYSVVVSNYKATVTLHWVLDDKTQYLLQRMIQYICKESSKITLNTMAAGIVDLTNKESKVFQAIKPSEEIVGRLASLLPDLNDLLLQPENTPKLLFGK